MWNAVEEALEEVPEVLQSCSIESTDDSHDSKLSGKDIVSLILEEKDGEKQIFTDTNENIKAIINHEKETQENEVLDNKYNYCNDSTKDVHKSTKCSLLENMILDKTVIKDTSISNDEASPSSSNWSVESFHISDSSGSARDRSISELSVSVPVHKLMSSKAEKDISAIVEELSHVDSSKKDLSGIESVHSSHKVDFSLDMIETEGDESLRSYQSGSKKPISEISLHESSQDEEPGNENCRRLSPRKSGVVSPWFKESLDEIGPYLSSCSSVDFNSYTPRPQNISNAINSLSYTGTDNDVPVDKFVKKIDRTDLESSQTVKQKPAEEYTYIEGILTIESLEDDDEIKTETIDDKPSLDKGNNMPCDKIDENNVMLCKVCDKPRSDIESGAGKCTQSTNQNAHLEVLESCRCDEESSKSNGQDVGALSLCISHDKDIDVGKINEISNMCNTCISELSSQDLELTSSLQDSKVTASESASSPEDTEPASSSQHTELSLTKESKSASSKDSLVYSQSTGVKDDEKVSDSESVLDILSDVSESSEYVFGVMCKSPISVITEKTEESGQDKHSLDLSTHVSDQEGNSIGFTSPAEEDKCGGRHSTPKKFCQGNEKFVQNLEVKWNKPDEAQGEVDKNYNKSSSSQISRFSQGAKVKKLETSFRPRSPPFPGNIGLSPGPIRTNNLKKNNSKSMSNLIFSQEVTKGNKNWSLSTENLSSQVNSPRVYSLSPSHNAKKRGQYLSPRDSNNLRRRCLSAMALNDDNAKHYLQRKKAQSLSRLNQRSSSLNSITSFQKSDYSHIQSKVKQYIMEMKEKDAKNSSRVVSASSSPNKQSVQLSASNTFIIDEDLLKELSRLTHGDEENLPKELSSLHKKLVEASLDPAFVEELLRLLIYERKSRHETDKTLAALQLNYDNLLARHAEAENLIDRLRFYKDIKISKEYEVILKVTEEENRKSNGSSRRTSPVPPSDGMPSNSEAETMHVPKADSFNLVKTTSYPVADPFVSFIDDGNALYVQEGIHCGKTNQELRSRKFVEKTETVTWTRDAEELEKKLKDFALLMGSNALCEEEKKRIWKHILNVYWQVSSTFPSVMVQGNSNSSGLKLQELGQALQLMSARFHLSLQEKDFLPSPVRGQEEGRTKVFPDQSHTKRIENDDDARPLSNISVGSMKKQVDENLSIVSLNRNKNYAGAVDVIVKKTQEKDKFSAVSGDEVYSYGGSEHNTKSKQIGQRKKEADRKKDQVSLLQSPTHSQESMKTVGPLEKVKLWQATLTDPSLAPGDYDDNSESHTPSVLSLSSSQPFVPNCHEEGEGPGVLCHPQTDRIEGVESDDGLYYFKGEKKGTTVKHTGNSPSGRLQRGKSWEGEAREDKELTWPSRRGSSVTPRGRVRGAAKPRDMDSGCPGSDRSTRFSHNASLEQHDNSLRWPHLFDQYEGGLETSVHREEVNGNACVSNSDTTPKVISSTLVDGKAIVNDTCNISSVESSIPVSSNSLRKAQEKKESTRTDANSNPFSRGSIHRASTVKTISTVKEIELCKSSEGPSRNEDQDHEVNHSIMGIEDKQLQSNSSNKRRFRELDKRYRSHVSQGKSNAGRGSHSSSYQGSGKSSSSSSSRTSKSPLDIHTNISRLKKDLEILKSQMLNLTGYMLKERQQQDFEDMQGSKTRKKRTARVPLKAVNPVSCTDHSQSEEWDSQSHDLECHSKCKERKAVKDPLCYYIEGDKWLTRSPRKQSSKRQEEHHAQVLDKTPVDQFGISEEVQEVCRCAKSMLKGKQSDQDLRNIGLRGCAHQDEKRTPESRRSSRLERVSGSSVSSLRRKSGSMDNIRMGGNESIAEEILSNIAHDAKLSGLYRVPSAPGGLSTLQPAVSSPIIYIEHYNFHGGCKNKENEGIRKHSSLPSTPSKVKFRKYGSQQDLMTSLDEATLLAERLRLRSQAMLNVMRTTRLDNQASPIKRPKSARV